MGTRPWRELQVKLEDVRRRRAEAEDQLLADRVSGPPYSWEPSYGFSLFAQDPVTLAEAIEAVRRDRCTYYPSATCDCKYGVSLSLVGYPTGSEQTGCPELRATVRFLLDLAKERDGEA